MADYIGQLVYRITGDTSGIERSLDTTKTKVNSFGSSFGSSIGSITSKLGPLAAIIAGAFTVDKLISFNKKLLETASAANETSSRFANTFPSAIKQANASITELTTSYGYSTQAAQDVMSSSGGLLETLGMQDDKAAELSATVAKLGADMASYTNYAGGAKGAADALTKALLGETDSAKGLSLSLGDDALNSYAASLGKSVDSMSTAEKAQLRLNLALEQAGAMGAVGDMIKTANGYANTLRSVEGKIEDAEARAGQALVPAVTELTAEFGRAVEPGGVFAGVIDDIASAASSATSFIAGLLNSLNNISNKDKITENKQNLQSYEYQLQNILRLYDGSEEKLNRLAKAKDRDALSDKARYDALKSKIAEANAENDKLGKSLASDDKAKAQQRYNELVEEDRRAQGGVLANAERYSKSLKGMSVEQIAAQTKNLAAQEMAKGYLEDHAARQEEIIRLEKQYGLTVTANNYAADAPKRTPMRTSSIGKTDNNVAKAAEARAILLNLDKDLLTYGQHLSELPDEQIAAILQNLKQSTPAARDFVSSFGGLSNMARMMEDAGDEELSAGDLAAKWADELERAARAAKNIKTDPKALPEMSEAEKKLNAWAQGVRDQIDTVMDWSTQCTSLYTNLSNVASTYYNNKISGIDAAMEAELRAAGILDESETEKANRELALAKKSGNSTLIAEKKKAATKADIEEKYAKRKADLEFKGALMSWDFNVAQGLAQIPLAVLNAYSAGAKYGPVTAAIFAAIAGASAAASEAAIVMAKPKRSNYADGGIVPGNSYYDDKIQANVNAGEMILNSRQQKELWQAANGAGSSGTVQVNVYLPSNELWFSQLYDATSNGLAMVSPKGIAAR